MPPHAHARRSATSLVLGAALLASTGQPARAAPCVDRTEQSAFDLSALQSRLMVMALLCDQQDGYNAFVERHRATLLISYVGVTRHFSRHYGAVGEQQRDQYVTELANSQSQEAVRQGHAFCRGAEAFFARALATGGGAVGNLLVERRIVNPYAPAVCGTNQPPAATLQPVVGPSTRRPAGEDAFMGTSAEPEPAQSAPADPRDARIAELTARLEALEQRKQRAPRPPVQRAPPGMDLARRN